jgi:3',5'-cyclic AMP phosphodiesterase CpdA
MSRALSLLFIAGLLSAQTQEIFVGKPYLQLGDAPNLAAQESMVVLWHTELATGAWSVEWHGSKSQTWKPVAAPAAQTVDAPGIPKHQVYRAKLTGLAPGDEFRYRVLKEGKPVFEAAGRARKSASQPVRFALFGDSSQNTPGQRAIAYQTSLQNPDFVFVTGDIVYTAGRISEYRDKYFPIYNAEKAGPETGAPLIRTVPFIAAPGNHDTILQNFQRFPDALVYFLYWDQPLNGPQVKGTKTAHELTGNEAAQPAFRAAAAPRYPVMANFSFDYGNAHWTVLDSNTYMDWSNPELRAWLEKDLAAAAGATWRFVAFHHPGFNSSRAHFTDQWMRLLAPVFEKAKVDVVFSGHVHNYQRSFPLTFVPDSAMPGPKGEVAGQWTLDKNFGDGSAAKPNGVIYIVSGGGGAGLYDPAQMNEPATWRGFTDKFISDEHSFPLVDIDGKSLRLKQITETGKEVDAFRIVK